MNVLSLFDGMSCGKLALEKAGFEIDNYYSSEIDKYAIKVSEANNPDIIRLGDVTKWREWDIDWSSIDLIIAGSPCQGFSQAGLMLEFEDPRSCLIFDFFDIMNHTIEHNNKVNYFLENVKMNKSIEESITNYIGHYPKLINSKLVSEQSRNRTYWASWSFDAPEDQNKKLIDILENLPDCPVGYAVRNKSKCLRVGGRNSPFGDRHEWDSPFQRIDKKGKVKPGNDKASCLTVGGNGCGNHSDMDIVHTPHATRRYSVTECERLQGIDDGYTQNKGVSNSQCYKMLSNGWEVRTVTHIFKQLKH